MPPLPLLLPLSRLQLLPRLLRSLLPPLPLLSLLPLSWLQLSPRSLPPPLPAMPLSRLQLSVRPVCIVHPPLLLIAVTDAAVSAGPTTAAAIISVAASLP